ncbi:hypothetical protein ABK040_009445 [Willaertia magna]
MSTVVGTKLSENSKKVINLSSNINELPLWNHPFFYLLNVHFIILFHLLCLLIGPSSKNILFSYFLLTPFIGFIILPLIDLFLDPGSWLYFETPIKIVDEQTKKYKRFYRLIPMIYTVSLSLVFWYSLSQVDKYNYLQFLCQSFSLGLVLTGSGAISHELIHKFSKLELLCGRIILWYHSYLHFHLEHLYSHHKRVGTPDDAATARFNETVYHFVPRSFLMGYLHAWNIENKFVKERYQGQPIYKKVLNHRMVIYTIFTLLLPLTCYYLFGKLALISFIISNIVGIFFVECANYVEHYGLTRMKIKDDNNNDNKDRLEESSDSDINVYEPISEKHSFDAAFRLGSYAYLNILYHADHHANPSTPYEKLRIMNESPKMPYSYGTMIVFALIPQFFFYIMNPIVQDYKNKIDQQVSKVNQQQQSSTTASLN